MFSALILCALCTLPFVLSVIPENCPDPKTIHPCMCKMNYDGACIMTCTIVSESDLKRLATVPNICNGHIHFVLYQSKITGIPTVLWTVLLSSKTVDVSIQHSTVEHLVPPGDPPLPRIYTPGEAAIRVDYAKGIDGWQWGQLQQFIPGGDLTIIIDNTPMTFLSSHFSLIASGNVHKVTIDRTLITTLPDRVFSSFQDMKSLSVQNNNLTDVQRSLFPRPAKGLQFLHLNGNFLTSLPEDLFVDMPKLAVVYLRDNKLTTLPSNLFEPLNSKSVHRIDLVNNPWTCDCNLMWITSGTNLNVDLGYCSTPENVARKKVVQLPLLLNC